MMRTHFAFICLAVITVVAPATLGENVNVITRDGTLFKEGDRPWFYAGTNNYYVGIDNTSTAVADEIISDAKAMNLNVLRLWGFNDDQAKSTKLQGPDARDYIEAGFQRLDYALAKCNENDIRVILPVTNYWNDYGGMQQYVDWNGGGSKESFYTNSDAQADYRNFISHLANRVNTVNGRMYKSDPTILAWQLANEPRYQSDPVVSDGSALTNWINDTAGHMKSSIGVQQMISTGMEGFYDTGNTGQGGVNWMDNEGTDYISQHAGTNIDAAGFHVYQDHWSLTDDQATDWIVNHIRDARRDPSLGKPVIMDEYGLMVPPNTMDDRNATFKDYLKVANREMANGTNFWTLYHEAYPDYDGFGVYYPGDSLTSEIIKEYGNKVRVLNTTGIHQLVGFEYDNDGFTKTWTEGAVVSGIQQVETPTWSLTNDGAIEIACSFGKLGDKAMIGAELKDFITGLAGIDVSDYGYEYLLARLMVADNTSFDPGDLSIKLYDKTGAWNYASGGGVDILEADMWYELAWPTATAGDLSELKEIGIDIWANSAYSGNIYVDFIGGDLTSLNDNVVPVPGAVLLGILGLSVAGMKLRKYA